MNIFSILYSAFWAEITAVPFIAVYVLAGFAFGAKKTDRKEMYINLMYWPFWVFGNLSVAAFLYEAYVDDLLAWAHSHGLSILLGYVHPAFWMLATLFLFDFFYYWYHRTEHVTRLWHYHAVHHADVGMNATTAFRHHFLENFIRVPFVDIPSAFIVISAFNDPSISTLGYVMVQFVAYLGLFAHANLRVSFGPLSWLLINPQVHRIHHSCEPQHADKNFAAYFPILDVIFGTYYHPSRGEWPDTGVHDIGRTLSNPVKMLKHPFERWVADKQL